MCMQCITFQTRKQTDATCILWENVRDDENGIEKPDNELTTTLLENITTLAQLHQYKRAEEKQQKITHCIIVYQQ